MNKKTIFLTAITVAAIFVAMPIHGHNHGQGDAVKRPLPQQTAMAQATQAEMTVGGSCGMCKRRIETAALSVAGVSSASWELRTRKLTLAFDASQTDLDAIGKVIAEAGHDNDRQKADDAVYNNLHGCCKYRN